MAKQAWTHPRLGNFAAGDYWDRKINVPEFAAFSYDTGYSNAPRSTGDIRFGFGPHSSKEKLPAPTPEMIAVADRILNDPAALVQKVIDALWEEFNGRGPTSGMSWRGALVPGSDSFGNLGEPPPSSAQELLEMLQLSGIIVEDKWWDYPKPIAILVFSALFEQEHGVSVLTDGLTILGTGLAGEAEIWEHLRPPESFDERDE